MEDFNKLAANIQRQREEVKDENDPENNTVHRPLLKRNRTLSSNPLAKASRMESLDYEINENDLFKQDWRSRSKVDVLQYNFLKWLLAFLVGLLTGLIATLMNLAVENIADYKLVAVVKYIDQKRYIMGFIYVASVNFLLTLVAAVLCVCFAPTAAGSGIPEIKSYLNGVDTPNMFGVNTLIVKIIGSICAVAAGLDLGKEGPLVHIGTCIASLLGQGGSHNHRVKWRRWLRYLNNDKDRRDLMTCGSSSGLCAAFRAPVGGVLFGLEEVATWWTSALLWRTLFSTTVVIVVLRAFNNGPFGQGGLIMFDVSGVSVRYHVEDIIPVAVIGVIGGVLGSLYNHLLSKVLKFYSVMNGKGKLHKILLAMSVSIFTSTCMYGLPFLAKCQPCDSSLLESSCPTTGQPAGNFRQFNCPKGYYNDLATLLLTTNDDAIRNIFSINTPNEFHIFSLALYFALYCVLGLITLGIAVPSGLFIPIILIGSSYGRMLAIAMGPYTKIDQGLYAVLGAAAFMAGSMRMTVSVCVIFLELTNNLLLLPITMLVLVIAKTVGDCFNRGINETIVELKGLPFLDVHPEPWMRDITVGELANIKPAVIILSGVEKVSRILEVLKNTTHNGFPVVDGGELHGIVSRSHLILVMKKKWFARESRRTEEWEVREKFSCIDLDERGGKIEEVRVSKDEMEMYVDLYPLVNTTPYTVVENMSLAKAMVLFVQVELRHMIVLPKYQGVRVPPVVAILTREDLRADNILRAFPQLKKLNRQ